MSTCSIRFPVHSGSRSAAILRPRRSLPMHDFCAAGYSSQRENAGGAGMESYGRAAIEPQHFAARCLCRFIRRARTAERRSQHDSRADLRDPRRVLRRTATLRQAVATATVPQGTLYIPGPGTARPNPFLSAGFFWLTEGNSSYNALRSGRDAPHQQGPGISRQLYLVKKSGYQLRADRSAGQQSGANGPEPQRSARGLGPVRA